MQIVTRSRTLCPCCRERVLTGTHADLGTDGKVRHIVCAAGMPKAVPQAGARPLGRCEFDVETY